MDMQVIQQKMPTQTTKRSILLDSNDKLDLNQFEEIPQNSQLYLINKQTLGTQKLDIKESKQLFSTNFQELKALVYEIVKNTYKDEADIIVSGITEKTKGIFDLNHYITYISQLSSQSKLPTITKFGNAYSISGNLYVYSYSKKYLKLITLDNILTLLSNQYCKNEQVMNQQAQLSGFLSGLQNNVSSYISSFNESVNEEFLTINNANAYKQNIELIVNNQMTEYVNSINYWKQKYRQLSEQFQNLSNQVNTLSGLISGLIQ